ncbi:hypothetical protein MIMGU_mgv1a021676mg [Erythranthe guttata]|uniref:Anaphase-promoting complex subunit 4 WD40 domain-containing protein n=1 Tax=Erythranthe guttata TaxID=4155 RepID=A0A022R3S0_ERYGU|nr:hypothetical protein MIMGU_mgv1a021676mg [Erythranthe guttata]
MATPSDSNAVVVEHPKTFLNLSFNQGGGRFTAATNEGFMVFETDPFTQTLRRTFSSNGRGGGGIGIAQSLPGSNIYALVGGGPTTKFPKNRVMIWDDQLRRCAYEFSYRSEVMSVRLRHDRIVVVLPQKIKVYDFSDLKLVHEMVTEHNPKGLCEISKTGPFVLLSLGLQKGHVTVHDYYRRRNKQFPAHDSDIACLSLLSDGKLFATASTKGTLIRVFDSTDGSLLQELRRGFERAEIHSLSFCPTAPRLAVSSDKGTVHVFNELAPAPVSRFSFIKGYLPKYLSYEWSVAHFRVKEGLRHMVSFGKEKNTLDIIGIDGRLYRCKFDPEAGGEMTTLESHNFIQTELN